MTKQTDSTSVHVTSCLAEILCRVVDRLSKFPLTDEQKIAKVTAAINPVVVEGGAS